MFWPACPKSQRRLHHFDFFLAAVDMPSSRQSEELLFGLVYTQSHSSSSSIYSQDLEDLIHRLDSSVRVAQLNTIERLLEENQQWEEEVALYRRTWNGLMDLLDKAFNLALLVKGSLEDFDDKKTSAEDK